MKEGEEVFQILPLKIREILTQCKLRFQDLQEIRLRVDKPVMIRYQNREYFLSSEKGRQTANKSSHIFTKEELRQAMEYISSYSLYAYEEQLKQGFITIKGGHRVGISGSVVMEHHKVKTVRHIACLNIRIAHQIYGCAKELYQRCSNLGKIQSTLIISPPGCGKTTLLRDLIRLTSNYGQTVGVVDERSELGAAYLGIPQNDLGIRSDVMDGCTKGEGLNMLIRSMAPDVIAVDEVGSKEDVDSLLFCAYRGCALLATAHGKSRDALLKNPYMREIVEKKMFERYVLLETSGHPGKVKKILDENGVELYD